MEERMTTLEPSAGGTCAERAQRIGPLLSAIGRELRERADALAVLLVERGRREAAELSVADLDSACAAQRSALRHAHRELARLGCHLVSLRPTVFSVAAGAGSERALFWCSDFRPHEHSSAEEAPRER
jgi:hypothetical protein